MIIRLEERMVGPHGFRSPDFLMQVDGATADKVALQSCLGSTTSLCWAYVV